MEQQLKENIKLLIEDGKKFEKIKFNILLSWNRNQFFSHLGNYISFYNRTLHTINQSSSIKEKASAIKELHFEDYSMNRAVQFLIFTLGPIASVILLLQWSYLREIKGNIKAGVQFFENLIQQE